MVQSIAVNGATNQLSSAFYDANGNMTSGVGATISYTEDNRMLAAAETSGATEGYWYAPDGKRVWRQRPDYSHDFYFWGAHGELVATFNDTSDGVVGTPYLTNFNAYFAGRLISQGGTYVVNSTAVLSDRVGSNRNGARFRPYGEEVTSTGNDRMKFATYFRDSTTGLDYAQQRYFASTYGRFNTPDPYQASAKGASNPGDPGTWNHYSYVAGDPVNRLDPTGRLFELACSSGDDSEDICFFGGGDPGGGDPVGGDPGPQQPVQPTPPPTPTGCSNWGCMPAALARAVSALENNPQCDQLFGTATTRANGFNPIQVISTVFSQGGGLVNGAPVGAAFLPVVSSILGNVAITAPNVSPGGGASVFIAGGSSSLWNLAGAINNTLFQAETLLHELGHVYSFIVGSGGSQIAYDGFSTVTSEANQALVEQKCFP